MALIDTIRFRAPRKLKDRFNRLARLDYKKPSDLGRDLIRQYVERREAEMSKQPT